MDLHDDFGQLISALRLTIGDRLEKATDILDSMYTNMKEVAFDLMPRTLTDQTLPEAVAELYHQLSLGGSIRFQFTPFGWEEVFPKSSEIDIYRIIQELTNNIVKYAGAQQITTQLTGLESGLSIMIEDDGQGYDPQSFYHGAGHGWKNVKSRLDLLGGELEIDSQPGRRGSTINIHIPYLLSLQKAA